MTNYAQERFDLGRRAAHLFNDLLTEINDTDEERQKELRKREADHSRHIDHLDEIHARQRKLWDEQTDLREIANMVLGQFMPPDSDDLVGEDAGKFDDWAAELMEGVVYDIDDTTVSAAVPSATKN